MAYIERLLHAKTGEELELAPDFCVITDGPGHTVFDQITVNEICNKEKVVIIFDHDIPAGNFDSAKIQKELIEISKSGDLEFVQSKGIGYHVMIDEYVKAGNIVVSCGEHNTVYGAVGALGLNLSVDEMVKVLSTNKFSFTVPETVNIYLSGVFNDNVTCKDFMLQLIGEVGETGFSGKALEFCGLAVQTLSLAEKMTLCTLAGRTGAVTAFITEAAVNADVAGKYQYCLNNVKPSVALPGNLSMIQPIEKIGQVDVAACFIGGCTGGSLEDLRSCAQILKGKRVATDTRLTIAPATNEIYLAAIEEGLIEIFIDCGAQIINPGCASCVTTSKGVVGDGETMLSSACYNYPGCSGTKDSKVYVLNAKSVAASALAGYICVANK